MLSKFLARSLMMIVPQKSPAVITLQPDTTAPTTVNVSNAWLKPLDVALSIYGNLNLQGDETRINVSQQELNPADDGREIRARDRIEINGTRYIVLSATLKSVRTRWECIARKEIN